LPITAIRLDATAVASASYIVGATLLLKGTTPMRRPVMFSSTPPIAAPSISRRLR